MFPGQGLQRVRLETFRRWKSWCVPSSSPGNLLHNFSPQRGLTYLLCEASPAQHSELATCSSIHTFFLCLPFPQWLALFCAQPSPPWDSESSVLFLSTSLLLGMVLALMGDPISTSSRPRANDLNSLCLGFLDGKSQNDARSFHELGQKLNATVHKILEEPLGVALWKGRSILTVNGALKTLPHPDMATVNLWSRDLSFKKCILLECSEANEGRSTSPRGIYMSGGGRGLDRKLPMAGQRFMNKTAIKAYPTVTAAPKKKKKKS